MNQEELAKIEARVNAAECDEWQERDHCHALIAALKPFAEAAKNFDGMPIYDPKEWFVYGGTKAHDGTSGAITLADLRRAAEVLK